MSIGGESVNVLYNIPLYRSGVLDGTSTAIGLSNEALRAKPSTGTSFPNQENIELPIYHPETGAPMRNYTIYTSGINSNKVMTRLNKDFPTYNYIKIPRQIKN
jgi:hypothetical protein